MESPHATELGALPFDDIGAPVGAVRLQARTLESDAIFERARDALIISDRELRVVRVNLAATQLLGRPAGELVGIHATEVVAPESIPDLMAGWAEALENGGGSGVLTIVKPCGVRRMTEYTTTMDVYPGFHLVALRDVTERVEVEAALRRTMAAVVAAERRYVELIEALPEGIVAVDADGLIMLVNSRTEQMFGYCRGELIGQPLELLVPHERRAEHARSRGAFGRGAVQGAMRHAADLRGRRKDGSEFRADISLSSVDGDDGRSVTAVVSDITERVLLETQLQRTQKLEAVGSLAGGVAHDFNNILQVIAGYTSSLQLRAETHEEHGELQEIAVAVGRAASLTRQLLAFSRRQVMEPVVIDLNAVVEETERMLARMVGDNIQIVTNLDPSVRPIRADRAQLEQVIANLVVNARDAIADGGRITISTRNAHRDGPHVMLSIEDNGAGMDDATAAQAFEPFFTTKAPGEGSGLGLATVYGIVTQSGGSVQIERAQGGGTVVVVCLPALSEGVMPSAAAEVIVPAGGGSERVLLVEDEPVVQRLIASLLESFGYRVTAVSSGGDALEAAAGCEPFDLLITDYVLPGMDGSAVASSLRALGAVSPVLFISGYAPDTELGDARAQGPTAFLQKPFARDALAVQVRSLLDVGAKR
jgi:hypothetical protein